MEIVSWYNYLLFYRFINFARYRTFSFSSFHCLWPITSKTCIILLFCFFQFDKYKIHLIECKGWRTKSNKNKSVLDVKNKTHLFSKSFHFFLAAFNMSWIDVAASDYIWSPHFSSVHALEKWSEGLRESWDIEISPLLTKISSHCE